jgi:hypothetical protein
MQVPSDDQESFNTISKPFKDVFNETVLLMARTQHERLMPIFGCRYKIRVVEALAGTWLSRVTWYIRGDAAAAYEPTLVGLLESELAGGLQRHGVVGGGSVPNFPDLYKRGSVPSGYKPAEFNPDVIYPGQRFILIDTLPTEKLTFEEPIIISVPRQNFWQSVWLGIVWGAKGDIGVGGAHHAAGAVMNVGDMLQYEEVRRFAGLRVSGWRVGLGAGASSGATLVVFVNYPTIASLNTFVDDGWDWSIALGVSVPRGSPKLVQTLFRYVQDLRSVKKLTSSGKKGELLKSTLETIIQNLKGGIPSDGARFTITLPVPFTGPGKHLWLGRSASEYSTFWARDFREEP